MAIYCVVMVFFVNVEHYIDIFDQRIAATLLLLVVMSFTAQMVSSVWKERNEALENVEQEVKARTNQLLDVLAQLRESKRLTEVLSQQKSEFMAFLCHELRNPLHAIYNMTLMPNEDPEQKPRGKIESANWRSICSYCEYMMALLNDGGSLALFPNPDLCSTRL